MKYLFLALAIVLEVIGSGFLNASKGFSKLLPSCIAVIAYLGCFYFLSITLKHLPLGLVYAVWAGVGIVLTALVSVFLFKQPMDLPAIIGMALIVAGVLVMNIFSKTAHH